MTTTTSPHHLRATLRRSWKQYVALHDRRQLLDRPWLEDVLHWSSDGELHGHLPPSVAEGPRSVTADGWCPGLR